MSDDQSHPEFADEIARQKAPRSPGERRPLPGCLPLGLGAVVALFISVIGLCGGGPPPNYLGMWTFLIAFAVAAILFVAAVIIGLYKVFTGR